MPQEGKLQKLISVSSCVQSAQRAMLVVHTVDKELCLPIELMQ